MNPTFLKTGDILHCSGKNLNSKLVKKFTKSKFTHSAVFIEVWGEPYVLDAQKDGVNLRAWADWLLEYEYDIIIHRSSTVTNEKTFAQRALSRVGCSAYSFEEIIMKKPFQLLTGRWRKKKYESLYCSEYIAWIYCIEKVYNFTPQDLHDWCKKNFFYEIVI
jgi:hypothetical protein